MIDIHTHLLPAFDDGSPSAEHSWQVLARMALEGVLVVVCTPHLKASQIGEAPLELRSERLRVLKTGVPGGVTILPGWEIMLDVAGVDLTPQWLGLGSSPARLVEFPRGGVPGGAAQEILRLSKAGLIPVVAHPERYRECTPDVVGYWKELGAVIQVDAMALLAGGPSGAAALRLLSAGMVDVVASDNHGDRRSLAAARLWLQEVGAAEQAVLLTYENPRRLLAGESLLAVAPLERGRSLRSRLRKVFDALGIGPWWQRGDAS